MIGLIIEKNVAKKYNCLQAYESGWDLEFPISEDKLDHDYGIDFMVEFEDGDLGAVQVKSVENFGNALRCFKSQYKTTDKYELLKHSCKYDI